MTVSLHRVPVALKRPTKVPDLIVYADVIVKAMTGNPWFPTPVPSLAAVRAAINKLAKTETAALSRMRGLKEARNEALAPLVALLTRLKAYVQGVADDNPDSAAAIIESAGMSVAARSNNAKPPFAVSRGPVAGSVRLVAKAAAKVATYEWQLSKDGGESWVGLPKTLQAKTTVQGLVPGGTYSFRMRPLTRRGVGDWYEPVSYVVQ